MYREFTAAGLRQQDEAEVVTLGAYQTVRVWVLTKNKKKMPKFSDLISWSKPSVQAKGRPEHARAMLELLAARMGGKVRSRVDAKELSR